MRLLTKCFMILGLVVFANKCHAKPLDSTAQIIKYEVERSALGSYKYNFETTNGLNREEVGDILNENTDQQTIEVRGSYRYFSPDGTEVVVTYIADKGGFRPKVDLISPGAASNRKTNEITNTGGFQYLNKQNRTSTNPNEFTDFIGTALLASLSG